MGTDIPAVQAETLETVEKLTKLAQEGALTPQDLIDIQTIIDRHKNNNRNPVQGTIEGVNKGLGLSIDAIRSDPLIRYMISTSFSLHNVNQTKFSGTSTYYRKNGNGALDDSKEEWYGLSEDCRYWCQGDRSTNAFVITSHDVQQDGSTVIYLAFSDNRFDNRKNLSGLAVKIPKEHPNKEGVKEYLLNGGNMIYLFKAIMPHQFTERKEGDGGDIWEKILQRAIARNPLS